MFTATNRRVYFDHNATTPLRPVARAAMDLAHDRGGNASSVHAEGRTARAMVEKARKQIASPLDVDPAQVIFTSGATESNNGILRGFPDRKIFISAVEHPCVHENRGENSTLIPVTQDGVVDVAAFEQMIAACDRPALVSVMTVNNETGVIQPIAEIMTIAKKYNAITHTDAVQALGRLPITRAALNVDFLTLSAHKVGGPQGVGATIIAPGAPLPRFIIGGSQERNHRAGTENVPAIAGFGAAVEEAIHQRDTYVTTLTHLREEMEREMKRISPSIRIYGVNAPRVANTICLTVPHVSSETMLMAMDIDGVAISSGAACSSGTVRPSRVLMQMGVSEEDAKTALRISLGWNSTQDDVEKFLTIWQKISARLMS